MSKAFDKATRIQICTLCMTIGLANLGEYMITLGLVYHLSTKFGLNSFLIGIGSSCLTTGYLLSLYLFQKVLVKLKPGRVILTAVISMSTMTIVMALAKSYIVFFIALFLFGCSKSMLWPQLAGLIGRGKEGRLLSRAQTSFSFAWSFLAGISFYISGYILQYSTTEIFFIAAGLIFIGSVALMSSALTRKAESEKVNASITGQVESPSKLWYFSLVGLVMQYSLKFAISTCLPLFARDSLGFVETQTGFVLSVSGITISLLFFVFGKVKWWKLSGIFVIIPQFAIMLLFLYAKSAVTYQSLIIFNLIYGVIFSYTYTQNLFTTTCGTAHKARRVMTYQFWLTLGSTMGSMLGGLLYKNYGWSSMMNTFFFAYLLIFIIEIAIYFVIKKRGNREVISYYNPN